MLLGRCGTHLVHAGRPTARGASDTVRCRIIPCDRTGSTHLRSRFLCLRGRTVSPRSGSPSHIAPKHASQHTRGRVSRPVPCGGCDGRGNRAPAACGFRENVTFAVDRDAGRVPRLFTQRRSHHTNTSTGTNRWAKRAPAISCQPLVTCGGCMKPAVACFRELRGSIRYMESTGRSVRPTASTGSDQ